MLQVLSVVADFNGKNPNFKKYMVEQEKNELNSDRSFEQILADAKRRLNNGETTTNRM